jgi:hypothetical protein
MRDAQEIRHPWRHVHGTLLSLGCAICLLGQASAARGIEATRLQGQEKSTVLNLVGETLRRREGRDLGRVLEVIPVSIFGRGTEEQWVVEDQGGRRHAFWILKVTQWAGSPGSRVQVQGLPDLPLSPRGPSRFLRPPSQGDAMEQLVALLRIQANMEAQREDCGIKLLDIQAIQREGIVARERWIAETCTGEQVSFAVQFGPGPFDPTQIPREVTLRNQLPSSRAVHVQKEASGMVPTQAPVVASLPKAVPNPPQPTGQTVAVLARSISLPSLPKTVEEAHRQHDTLRPTLDQGLADLREAIRAALKELPELPDQAMAPPGQEQLFEALLDLYAAPEYPTLGTAFMEAWEAWARTLQSSGMVGGTDWTPEDQRQQRRLAQTLLNSAQRTWITWNPPVMIGPARARGGGGPQMGPGIAGRELFQFLLDKVVLQSLTNRVLDKMAPAVNPSWERLRRYLNDSVLRMADLEAQVRSQGPTADLVPFLAHTRLAVMQRFEQALWYATVVWAQVAAKDLPTAPDG